MTFDWNAPEMKGGVELTSFKIYQALNGGVYSAILNTPSTANPTITVQTQSSLTTVQTYRFKVSAVNVVGEGPLSSEIVVIAANMPE